MLFAVSFVSDIIISRVLKILTIHFQRVLKVLALTILWWVGFVTNFVEPRLQKITSFTQEPPGLRYYVRNRTLSVWVGPD